MHADQGGAVTWGEWLYFFGSVTVFAASLFAAALAAFAWQEPQLRHAIAFQARPDQLASLPSMAVLVPARH